MNGIIEAILGLIGAVFMTVVTWAVKRQMNEVSDVKSEITRVDREIKSIDDRLNKALGERQVRQIIEDKLEPLNSKLIGLEDRLRDYQNHVVRIESKIDKLLDYMVKK